MKLARALFLFMAVFLPTTWTIAQAADPPAGGEMKDAKPKKKGKKKKDEGDMGKGDKGDMKK
jgi:hypothetical protein